MPVKMRLRRVGARHQPKYRIVVADSRSPRDGRFIETLGHYNPLTDPETVVMDTERAKHWLQHGAQPTEAVGRLLKAQGVEH
ncbi:MAG: 30S ribosomal protein S16 [Armatimonadota bacterium]|nr:30S ribosomal protein S16 [Armatimonadota bacterium]